jgi:tetratricopeptide (TPR) repeat protein
LQYEYACAVGESLFESKFSKCKNPQTAINMYVKDQLRRAQLLANFPASKRLSLGDVLKERGVKSPEAPVDLATSTIKYLKSTGGSDLQQNLAYLCAVVGLNSGKDAYRSFDEVLNNWSQIEITPERGEAFAAVLSQIGDYYLALGTPDALNQAKRAFELAQKSWQVIGAKDSKSVGSRGLNNAAVAEDRLGQVQRLLGHNTEAASYFQKAADDFKVASKSDTLDRAKDLFNAADAQWAAGEFLNSIRTHKEALKIWSATRAN